MPTFRKNNEPCNKIKDNYTKWALVSAELLVKMIFFIISKR